MAQWRHMDFDLMVYSEDYHEVNSLQVGKTGRH